MGFFDRVAFRPFNEVEIDGQKAGADADDEEQENPEEVDSDENQEADEADGEITGDTADPGTPVPDEADTAVIPAEQPAGDGGTGAEIPPQNDPAPEGENDVPPEDAPEEGDVAEPANDVATDTDYDIPDDTTGELGDETGDVGELGDEPNPEETVDTTGELGDETGTDGELGDDDNGELGDTGNVDTGADTGSDVGDDAGGTGEIEGQDGEIADDGGAVDGTGGAGATADGEGPEGVRGDGNVDGQVGEDDGTIGDGSEDGTVGDDTGGEEGGSGSINDDIKNIENNLLADLTDEQKQIQSDELRKNFISMYNTTMEVIEKVNNIQKDEDSLSVFEFISTQLLILKDILNMTITKTFDTKSYFENMNTYQYCLAILSKVDELIKELEKKQKKVEGD